MKRFWAVLLLLSITVTTLALPVYANSSDMADYQYRFKDGEIVKEPKPDERQLLVDEYRDQRLEENGDISVYPGSGQTVTTMSLKGESFNIDKVRGQLETAISTLPSGQNTVTMRLVNLAGDFSVGDFILLRKTASNAGLELEIYVDRVVNGKILTRSYLNKSNMDSGYVLGVDDLKLSGVGSMVEKSGSEDNTVLYIGENGGSVVVAQWLPETMNTANLHLYSYNLAHNSYKKLSMKDAYMGENSYLYFTVASGGYYIVSDGEL